MDGGKPDRAASAAHLSLFTAKLPATMSWDGYVNQLMESGAFESVCLMGQDGTVWASTPDFGVSFARLPLLPRCQRGAPVPCMRAAPAPAPARGIHTHAFLHCVPCPSPARTTWTGGQ